MRPSLEVAVEISQCSDAVRECFETLCEEVERLTRENNELRARVNQNSKNSSRPPSSDPFIKPKSLREKTGRKPGGQPGHKGSTIKVCEAPDVVVDHNIDSCKNCGTDISEELPTGHKSRQVVDVKIIKVVTEHRAQVKTCFKCGKENSADFPQGVDHYIQYGDTLNAIVVCLNKGNYIPYERLKKISKDIFNIPVSSGTLVNIVHRCGKSLDDSMEHIKEQLKQSKVIHCDETGTRVKGKNFWLHTAGNEQFTYVETHPKRGSMATKDIGILPEFEGVAVHDFWKSYYNYDNCSHAICNSHILRELIGITENFNQAWSEQMRTLLIDIKKGVDAAGGALPPEEAATFKNQYDEILCCGEKENPIYSDVSSGKRKRGRKARSKARNLLDRMILFKEDILRFMILPEVPFDNNLAERDIRMSKVQQKVSGGFRSNEGNETFDKIRSYISTANKQGKSTFDALQAAVSGRPMFTSKS